MKRRLRTHEVLPLQLPKATADAVRAMAAACDISASAVVSSLLANNVDDLVRISSLVTEARGTENVPFDDVCDVMAHLWMETAIRLSIGSDNAFPWRTGDDTLRNQWAEDLEILKLRKRIHAMRRHEVRDPD